MVGRTRTPVGRGAPRSPHDAEFIQRFDADFRLPLVVSAILPLIVVPQTGNWVSLVIGVVTWIVFLVDYVVHVRHLEHFGRTGFGRFDLVVVVVTAPWFLLPGVHSGSFVVLLRLARIARILMVSHGARQLFDRLGRVAGVAIGVLATSSLVAYYAEHPTNPEFATVGDAFWWGIVTLTTVGYGDVVPKTPTGRWAGVVLMITGVAVLGLLAGSLASFFRLDSRTGPAATPAVDERDQAAGDTPGQPTAPDPGPGLAALVNEVAALRQQVAALTDRIASLGGASGGDPPAGAPGQAR